MKKLSAILSVVMMLVASVAFGQVTRIYDIQYTTDSSGDSPLVDSTVTIQGIVTGESYAYGDEFFVQDSVGAWSGILVYTGDMSDPVDVAQGDLVTVTGPVSENYGLTEIKPTSVIVDSMWAGEIEPIVVSSGDIGTGGSMAEAYESVLIKIENAEITDPDLGFGEWSINDGSGDVRVDDNAEYYFWPSEYDSVKSVVGPLYYSFGDTKIEPRLAKDVLGGGDYTRIQAFQQVNGGNLARIGTEVDNDSLDFSPMLSYNSDASAPLPGAEPITIHGIVTMPTGLSYAGAGIKFIITDVHGGPWSSVLLYSPDSTAFPVLYEGDEVSVAGYVGEYTTSPSNMTEFWISGEVQLGTVGNDVPPVSVVSTGDLRWPTTAEQWGTVTVRVKDVTVVANDYLYAEWGVDDGTGEVRIDDDSDSLATFIRPPMGTHVDSIQGWVYHHFGFYSDSSTYKVEPLYKDDIVIGEGPPSITNVARNPGAPTPSDNVTVSANLTDNSQVVSAQIMYRVNGGAYQSADMSLVSGIAWSGEIAAQSEGDWVDYFIKATDDNSTTTIMPADTSMSQYSYRVASNLSITDLQYTPWPSGNTPYEGVQVTVSGVVTADTAFNDNEGGYVIQEPDATEWGGIYVYGVTQALLKGQEVTVTGAVGDYIANFSDAYGYQWDGNTTIVASNVTVDGDGTVPDALVMTTSDLETNPEMYEGMLVRVNNVEVSAVNQYDWTITDDSGGHILIDDDASLLSWFDDLQVGSQVGDIRGIWTYSYGTFKIELRDDNDHGEITGINEDVVTQPVTYALEQNYPNPFNPSTNIKFSLAETGPVTVAIYNVRGQLVKTLMRDNVMQSGYHVIYWNGQNAGGEQVGSGVYIYRIKAGNFIKARKMTLIR